MFGYTMSSATKNPELNALFKSVLFRPLRPADKGAARWAPYRAGVDASGKHETAWQEWWGEQLVLSKQYDECERRAGKWFTIEDIRLDKSSEEPRDHFDSRPSTAEFMAHWTVQVATNMDVEAEAGQRRNRRWFQTEGSWVTAPLIGQVRPRLA